MVETQLCKLRGTIDTFPVGSAYSIFFIYNIVFVNYTYDMVVNTQFRNFYGRPIARVLYFILMKDIGR